MLYYSWMNALCVPVPVPVLERSWETGVSCSYSEGLRTTITSQFSGLGWKLQHENIKKYFTSASKCILKIYVDRRCARFITAQKNSNNHERSAAIGNPRCSHILPSSSCPGFARNGFAASLPNSCFCSISLIYLLAQVTQNGSLDPHTESNRTKEGVG